jgi:hypothetical protein
MKRMQFWRDVDSGSSRFPENPLIPLDDRSAPDALGMVIRALLGADNLAKGALSVPNR